MAYRTVGSIARALGAIALAACACMPPDARAAPPSHAHPSHADACCGAAALNRLAVPPAYDPRTTNPIVLENALPGAPPAEWDISGAGDPSIQGFASEFSVNLGETVDFRIDTDADEYTIEIYRLGYYAGLGARRVATVLPDVPLPQVQPACAADPSTGLVDCGTWAVSAHWDVPPDAVSGVYIARLERTDTGGASHIAFVVRDDHRGADILFQTADTTWQAYNRYGGNSLYSGAPAGRAFKVSYNRPFITRATEPEDWVFNAEFPMIRWLEANGFDVSYCAGIDAHRAPAEPLEHKAFLSVGHDEYWSQEQRAAIEAARDAGVHLAFFSGNEVFWKIRWENSIDGNATPDRTMVCYKETHAGAKIDPSPQWTGTWRDPRFSPPSDGGRPENALTGTIFTVNCCGYPIEVPAELGNLRFWRNTGIDALAPGQVAVLTADTLGYEWDEAPDDLFAPPGLVRMSRTTHIVNQRVTDNGSNFAPGLATHALTLYRAPSGALVFGAGTIQWSWGLDGVHDRGASSPDIRMQQATINLLADMGILPQTIQGGLFPATQTTDATPPIVTIDAPAPGQSVEVGQTILISGSAVDAEGVVGAVEVSTDDGATWRAAAGRDAWNFHWVPLADGTASIRVRASDDSANLSAPSAPRSVTIEPFSGCEITVWNDAATPASANNNDGQPIEIGCKFRATQDGWIKGVRFYKGDLHTGVRIGRLWSASGELLAERTFTAETASGWQQVDFDAPVALAAGVTCIASVFSPSGYYPFTPQGLAVGVQNGPIRALGSGEHGPNGVYLYGPSGGFPTDAYMASNYWVDVVFDACAEPPPPPPQAVTLFDGTPNVGTDPNDVGAVELGVKFSCDQDASVTALRFYKHPQNTGPHIGTLWTIDGQILARVTYTDESASGWQEQALDAPVPIAAGQTCIASYHTTTGHYAFTPQFFAVEHSAPPLHAPASSESGGNGVYAYHPTPAFPSQTFNAANYWVDVVLETSPVVDETPPAVVMVSPESDADDVPITTTVSAVFSERIDPATLNTDTFTLSDDALSASVPAVLTYSHATRTAVLTPEAPLRHDATYTAALMGLPEASPITDVAGNPLAQEFEWSFSTASPPPPPPDEGPGGPILVIASTENPFGRYYAEILRAEGLNAFTVTDITLVTPAVLDAHALVILSQFALTDDQAAMLDQWVNSGGRLIAMRPDPRLHATLGISAAGGTLAEGYFRVDDSAPPGAGIVGQPMQFHGAAALYNLAGAAPLAELFLDAVTPAAHPALTRRAVGPNGGIAAAFAFDLARSVVYTRQGNPAWAGQERDGLAPLRANDMFYGAAAGDPQPDWVDRSNVAIPQADELQRLLVNLIHELTVDLAPMPRFWYFPRGLKAVVVMTGDDHANNGTEPRFNQYLALSEAGCSVEDWECIRGSSYIYTNTPLAPAVADQFQAQGFEIALHPFQSCGWTPNQYASGLAAELAVFQANWPGITPPATNRTHCIAWSDWATQPREQASLGIRLDTNYYYWPPAWVNDTPGVFTGSAMPMRFADTDGTLIDCYQLATQMTDESGQTYPFHADTLLDRALGPEGFFGAFCANMHTDAPTSSGSDAIIGSAVARGVPVISALQLLDWVDGRSNSTFDSLHWDGQTLSFDLSLAQGSRGIEVMLPAEAGPGPLQSVSSPTRASIPFEVRTVKGVAYAFFRPPASGPIQALYAPLPPCAGDVNGDGSTNAADFVILAGNFGALVTMNTDGDLNGDGIVNAADFTIMAGDFGCTPP